MANIPFNEVSLYAVEGFDQSGTFGRQTVNGLLTYNNAGPLTPAVRQVATACAAPTFQSGGAASFMSVSVHTMCDAVTSVAVETPWFYINAGSSFIESAPGATASLGAWIEYPLGTFTQLTYNGLTTGTLPNGGRLLSDFATVRIPLFGRFRVWQRVIATAGWVLTVMGATNSFANGGEGLITTGITGSSVPPVQLQATDGTSTFRPSAIIALTTRRSVFAKGDSRLQGTVGDARTRGNPDVGEIGKGLGTGLTPAPYIQVGQNGDALGSFIATSAGQRANTVALAQYCSDVVMQLGTNDIVNSVSLATIQTNTATAKGFFAGKPVWLTTKAPKTTSTDSWATVANQTVDASNPVRITVNNWIRAYPAGYAGFFELSDGIESARDSGKFIPNVTTDGYHLTATGYDLLRDGLYISGQYFQ